MLFAEAQPASIGQGDIMPFYETVTTRMHYQEIGSGFPLLILPGGGLNATSGFFTSSAPFDPMEIFKDRYRCITMDLRNAPDGQSTGPVEADRPWDAYADDQIGLMDHLGIDRFLLMGFCIGGPFAWNLMQRAPQRIAASVLAQPSGFRPALPDQFYKNNMAGWGPKLCAKRPEITMEAIDAFLTRMYRTNPDFVFTVSRDFVRGCQTPVLVLPDDVPAHPLAVALETVALCPNAEVSRYPWKEPADLIGETIAQVARFMQRHAG